MEAIKVHNKGGLACAIGAKEGDALTGGDL
jgi:hypothetical protein